ncbi:MAG TPA: 16S rRNA (cytidine(1402)-2'-O)-methyltransferase [Gammaproteobacteria bacterium]|jgi:16S rRNA (cytidine1402-2'-O)-methyltransferase
MKQGCLYIVATPIGNLSDISQRAVETLKMVDLIAAEDTRHSQKLLTALGIQNRLVSLHDHNERTRSDSLVGRLINGENIALISDAGTPMISDPGYHLIRLAQDEGIRISPVPGPSAVVSALSVSGLPANRFYFHGFLPDRTAARKAALELLTGIQETLVFYESGKRISSCLSDIRDVFSGVREAVICRELTKLHETIQRGTVDTLLAGFKAGELDERGEFVLLIEGTTRKQDVDLQLIQRLLDELKGSVPAGKLASAVSRALRCPRKLVYELIMNMKDD